MLKVVSLNDVKIYVNFTRTETWNRRRWRWQATAKLAKCIDRSFPSLALPPRFVSAPAHCKQNTTKHRQKINLLITFWLLYHIISYLFLLYFRPHVYSFLFSCPFLFGQADHGALWTLLTAQFIDILRYSYFIPLCVRILANTLHRMSTRAVNNDDQSCNQVISYSWSK